MSAEESFASIEAAHDALVAALARRWRLAEQIHAAGGGAFVFQPSAEMMELRRLLRGGGAPASAVGRMWRAVCGDLLVAQGLKTVWTAAGDPAQMIEGARGYFGFGANIQPAAGVREAMERVFNETGVLACLPWPESAGAGQWWPMLNENRYRELSILAGWPILAHVTPRVAIIGRGPVGPSGEDDMLATTHDDAHWAERHLINSGLEAEVSARARSLALVRIRGFVDPEDHRLEIARQAGLSGLRIVGVLPRI